MSSAIAASNPAATTWRTVRLADVCQFKPPKSIPRKALEDDSPVSFVPMGDLGELTKYFEARTVRRFGEVVKGYTYFADGDVLCAKITPCFENGKLGIAQNLENGVGFGSSEFVVMRSKGEIMPEFLYYYLSRDTFREAGQAVMSGAVGHKRVPKEYFEDLEVPLPPVGEQKRIVAVLDQAFAALDRARAYTEANLDNSEELVRSVVDERFRNLTSTNETTSLIELCGDRGVTYGVIKLGEHATEGVPCLRTSNVKPLQIDTEGVKRISERLSREYSRTVLQGGEVLVNVRGTLGGVSVVPDSMAGWNVSREVAMVDIASADPAYVAYFISSSIAEKWLTGVTKGAAYKGVNLSDLRKLKVPALDKNYQSRIAQKLRRSLNGISRVKEEYERKLSHIDSLRQALLQKAFGGELT